MQKPLRKSHKELLEGSGPAHIPYLVATSDANGTTTLDGGKFLPEAAEF